MNHARKVFAVALLATLAWVVAPVARVGSLDSERLRDAILGFGDRGSPR